MKELKVNVSLLANDDGIGSLPHTPTNCNGPQVSSTITMSIFCVHNHLIVKCKLFSLTS